jgi:hypothetical protein
MHGAHDTASYDGLCSDVPVAQQCVCDSVTLKQEDIYLSAVALTYTTCSSHPLTHPIMLSTKAFRASTVLPLRQRATGFRLRRRCRATCCNIALAVHGYRIQTSALAETIGEKHNVVLPAGRRSRKRHASATGRQRGGRRNVTMSMPRFIGRNKETVLRLVYFYLAGRVYIACPMKYSRVTFLF